MSFQIDDGCTDLVVDTAWSAIVGTCIVLQDDWASDDVERTRIKVCPEPFWRTLSRNSFLHFSFN
jgi:hypothetical protein